MTKLLIALSTSALFAVPLSAWANSSSSVGDYVTVDLHHQSYYDSATRQSNVLSSHFRVTMGNTSIRVGDYIRNFAIPTHQIKNISGYIVNVSVGLSLAPSTFEESTLDTLEERVDETLKEKEPFIRQQITAGVNYELSKSPQFTQLPPAQQAGFAAQLSEETTTKTIADLRESYRNKHEDRVSQIKKETSFQEILINVAYQLDNRTLLFLKVGKYQQAVATGLDRDDQTELDQISLRRNRTQRMSTAAPTTGATTGAIRRYDDFTVQAEIAIFHDRIPFMDINEYISHVVTLSEDDYDQHKRLSDIDSARVRLNIKSNMVDFYVTAGTYDGNEAYATGVVIRVTPKLKIHADYANSDRQETAEQGVSVFVSYDTKVFGKRLSLYAGQEQLTNMPILSLTDREDLTVNVAGGQITLWSGRYGQIQADFSLNVEYYTTDRENGNDDDGFKAGAQLRARYK